MNIKVTQLEQTRLKLSSTAAIYEWYLKQFAKFLDALLCYLQSEHKNNTYLIRLLWVMVVLYISLYMTYEIIYD